jgi:iron complex outermembrane receptor protein
VQRIAQGSDALVPETSENTSIGLVLDPIEGLTITADYWQITKDDTIGLFGEENHIALDLFYRLQAGASDCSQAFNAQVVREAATQDQIDAYTAAGLCPAGDVVRVDDVYVNLDTRELEGYDIGVYYDVDTSLGAFSFSYNGSFLEKYEQVASGPSLDLVNAVQAGELPSGVGIDGFADLIGKDGNQDERHSARLSWRQGAFGAALGAYRIGQFYQGTPNVKIAAMTTYDLTADYRFDVADTGARIRLGVKNLTDERAPLADRYFGYFADAHNDYGRYMYVDLRLSF